MHHYSSGYFLFIQEVYVSLNDVDGVTGVAAIRQVEPSIREQILQFESTGEFVIIIMSVLTFY